MKLRNVLVGTLLTAAAGFANASIVYTLDDFSEDQGPASDTTVDGVAVTDTMTMSNGTVRTISTSLVESFDPIQNAAVISYSNFDVNNGSKENAEVSVDWTFGANLLPGATSAIFSGIIIWADKITDIEFLMNGVSLATVSTVSGTDNEAFSFAFDPALFNAGGTLSMQLTGETSWDLVLDTFNITYSVPTPGTLALVGLSLVGFGLSRRRRQAA
ncbi:MAG: PEP-CTERM sorting domain-containing protein [Parahaliea sp.]